MKNVITDMLEEKSYILADGATGTNLFSMGLQTGDAPEFWNADHPDRVSRHYESCLLYTSPGPRDLSTSRMPSSA